MLKARLITALMLLAGLAIVLFVLPPFAVVGAFAAVAALAAWEWAGLMRQSPTRRHLYAAVMFGLCGFTYYLGAAALLPLFSLSAAFWLLLVPFWLQRRWTLVASGLLGDAVGILVILPTWAAMVVLQSASALLLLAAMALVWVADVAAYFAGRAFGRHKLAPNISPGKTWEGVAGAVLGVLIYGFVVLAASPLAGRLALPWFLLLLLLLLLTALSVVGDLYESMLKRLAGIKDSSQLLPGHGGVLDRIDSLTSVLPVLALLSLQWQS